MKVTMNAPADLSAFSHEEIALGLLNALWIKYDHGGISEGRSERADLLESVTRCAPLALHSYTVGDDRLMEEARRRSPEPRASLLELPLGLRSLPLDCFVCLTLEALRVWYDRDPMIPIGPDHYISIAERNIVFEIARLLDVKKGAEELRHLGHSYTNAQLIAEGRDRRREYSQRRDSSAE